MSYKANLEQLSISPTGKVASAVQADSATSATTASSASSVADASITTAKLANGAVTGIKRTNTVLVRQQISSGNKLVGATFSAVANCSGNPVKILFEPRPGAGSTSIVPTSPNTQIVSLCRFDLYRNGTFIGNLGSQVGAYHPALTSNFKFWPASAGGFYFVDQSPPVGNNTYAVILTTDADGGGEYVTFTQIDLVVREV